MEVLSTADVLRPRIKRSRSIYEREETNQENSPNHHQIVLYGGSIRNHSLNYAWNAYFDKNKVKKNIMVCCDLNKICNDILKGVENNSLTIKTFSFLLIGVCNIYKKKVYFIGQDYDFLKRKILSLYKNKEDNLNELINNKETKKRKGGKDNVEDSNNNNNNNNNNNSGTNKRRMSRTSLHIKRGSIGMNELLPSVIDDFTSRRSRFSLNADEISIAGTQQNSYDIFNENEINNQMMLDMSGYNYDNMHGEHVMEKVLDASYISRNSIPINNLEGLHFNRALSESFNHMDNINLDNSILNNMIPKNMFSNIDASLNGKSVMGDMNNLELNSLHRSELYSPVNDIYNIQDNNKNINDNNMNNMNNINISPFSNVVRTNEYTNDNVYNNISNEFSNMQNINSSNFMGNFNSINNSMNNRNDLYNLNPFMSMQSMNQDMNNRNNYPFEPRGSNYGNIDARSDVVVGSIFSPIKKKNIPKKNDYANMLNFETYQNFDYFDQKDDDAFIKKLNTLLGLDEAEEIILNDKNNDDNNKYNDNNNKNDDDNNQNNDDNNQNNDGNNKNNDRSDTNDVLNNSNSLASEKNNQLALHENDKGKEIIIEEQENQNMKKRKLEKHIIDRNYIIKDSVIRSMFRDERVDYKYFLIDTINNEIYEKIEKEYPGYQCFFLQTSSDKIKPVHKLEINFGYESFDHEKKKKELENYLISLGNNKSILCENKNVVFDNFNIKKCLDNIDEQMTYYNENDSLSNNFLSFEDNNEEYIEGSDNNIPSDGKNNNDNDDVYDDMHFEQVREEIGALDFHTSHNIHANDNIFNKDRFSIDPMLTQNEQLDLNLNDLNFKDDIESRINIESQMSKSLHMYRDGDSITEKNDNITSDINFVNDKLNSEFNSSPLNLSISDNYDFSNIFSKDNQSSLYSILEDKNIEIDINLNQDFDVIARELLEVYKNLSKKINYIFFDMITRNRKSKDEVAILFYVTLHLANLGYIYIMQKPILPEQINYYEEHFSRPILIQYIEKKKS
ncbi:hypothetical protein PFUGPA_03920 [Plasmodium falciparum Palo Alto/Uganda]|uniref:Rad21/Rec8-like protein N-terminal domain-containing protein n=5 Tax=Plasmodium falciparum TaxID=5833 RepID=Q8IL69_PLAF7|nr:conserved Plasmodium protein, unknown function [Plasmodium falciparum 3D7]ETW54048.1 hypothetical protein PFUGPA_03920 [Plasmodium falciparum Palo Alto/Uganda]ETW58357.1 hypothetical protein PFMC_05460 [Plasmodium falciparum CAMP/Malaysia]KAF4329638.1 hypothetical protein CYL21_2832 [Plasmodium falciparum NF54]PKC49474.1 hypothetical protein CK202_0179 [Plasmodium falciparum NF54]CZU00097.1 conserved Plasmodium protein, unknown function [Plasmodium falciparum 3D7]|eukprot:XP_001348554.1 conserved Plasmodium protein, unknown function [Plasmodium falciparum 3D7]